VPRVRFYPTANLDSWSGRSETQKRTNGQYDADGQQESHGVRRKGPSHPVVANGTIMPTSVVEALMQTVPGDEPATSSEELVPLGHAIQWAFDTLLTERERYVMEAIWFEGLSRRQLAERLPWGKSQIDRIERAARAKLGADPKLRELFESMSHRLRTAPEGGA
jgi:hypothetical protein